MAADFQYSRIDGFWLPSALTVEFASPPIESSEGVPAEQGGPFGRRTPPHRGTLTIHYSDYRVNAGLPDSVFAPEVGSRGGP